MSWRRLSLVLVLATLVVLAGCTAPALPGPGASTGDGAGAGGGGARGTQTASGTAAADPYGGRTLVVAVDNQVNASREFAPLVRRALDYWEENASRYAGYDVSYRVAPNASDPDFVVSFVAGIPSCGHENEHPAGCAPHITRPAQFSPPERVRVVGGLSDYSTAVVLRHEFGHTLGLDHDDEPRSVMNATVPLVTLPRPDAVDRPYAWANRTLSVYVDLGNVSDRDRPETRRQVDAVLGYFDQGAEGTVPENVSFVRTSDRLAADVVVQVGGTNPCERESGSCRRLGGIDPDDDGRVETYSRLEVYVAGLEPEAAGWHAGRHLGYALGLTSEEEFPEPLRSDATYEERRSDWWESE